MLKGDFNKVSKQFLAVFNRQVDTVKSVRIRSFSGPCFPAFGLNTSISSAFSPNAEKYRPEKLRIWILFTQYDFL